MDQIDKILELQIKIARAGEVERLGWWNIDATDSAGGGDFFKRFAGPLSGLSAIEAVLKGAEEFEKQQVENSTSVNTPISLFNPDCALRIKLQERLSHYKHFPDTLPDEIKILLDHDLGFNKEDFVKNLESFPRPSFERTPIGRMARGQLSSDLLEAMQQLASLLLPLEDEYPFPYKQVDN